MKQRRGSFIVVCVCLAVLAVLAAVFALTRTHPARASAYAHVSEVPKVIPAQGITVDEPCWGVRLLPASADDKTTVALSSESKAISAARQYEGDASLPAQAVFARVTIDATLPLAGEPSKDYANVKDMLAWVVTFTYPEPFNARFLGGPAPQPGETYSPRPPVMVTHDNVIIDAQTGQLVWGFFSK